MRVSPRAALVLSLLPAASAVAQGFSFADGRSLLHACMSHATQRYHLCVRFVVGAAEAVSSPAGAHGVRACPPADLWPVRFVEVVLDAARREPLGRNAGPIAAEAIARAYPCAGDARPDAGPSAR